jgi:sulfatase maturation enzyme AslB (radical SAM superfamily)
MDYVLNNYRFRKIDNKYIITTDHGSFCILSDKEFSDFRKGKISDEFKERLYESEIILDEKNLNESVRLMKRRNDFLFSGTSLHIMVVTLRCNMNCVYCHASSKPENEKEFDMDLETAKKTVDFIFQSPSKCITIEFQGGEPLLNWNVIKETVAYAKGKNLIAGKDLKITIVTNLEMMDEDKLSYLIENEVDICTSLDGPKVLHDYNRNFVKGSNYETVVKWIKKIKEKYSNRGIKDRKIHALVTLTKKSLEYSKEIVDEYIKNGLDVIHLRFLNKLGGEKKAWSEIYYSAPDFLDFWKKAVLKTLNE